MREVSREVLITDTLIHLIIVHSTGTVKLKSCNDPANGVLEQSAELLLDGIELCFNR
jgi:hypothetical protein